MNNKMPTKQIYLLVVGIIGIVAIILYSTYAIFTLEGRTNEVVTIHTPNSLKISEDIYEYNQVTVPKNSFITTDVDLYNPYDSYLCYSIWYKVVNTNIDTSLIKVYQNTENNLETSGVLPSLSNKRISLIIINDLNQDIKINIGSSSSKKETECILNIKEDKSLITKTISNPTKLSTYIKDNLNKSIDDPEGYLTYKNITNDIELSKDKTIYVSNKITYHNELFTLDNPEVINLEDIEKYQSNETNDYYTCLDTDKCRNIYHINTTSKETIDNITTSKITNYDYLVGYLQTTSGIKEITNNNHSNYLYYGDNPHNFIYFNCQNEQDSKTCELWQILGSIYDESTNTYLTKIIRADSIGLYNFNEENTNNFNNSTLYNYLNKEYKIYNTNYLEEHTYKQPYLSSIDNLLTDTVDSSSQIKSKVSLITLRDYINTSICTNRKISEYDRDCLNNNWLNKYDELPSWTLTMEYNETTTEELTKEEIIPDNDEIFTVSDKITLNKTTDSLNVRPVVYLKERILLTSGDGSLDNPFIIR